MKNICDWNNCNKIGEYKAPIEKDNSKKFRMLCLEHVKEFNKNWNYFSGMNDDQVINFLKSDMIWHKPTQSFSSADNFFKVLWNNTLRDELDKDKTPVEANLKWAISKERVSKGNFIGSDKINKQLADGVNKIRVGIKHEGRLIAREKTKIFNQSDLHIGEITSGTFGPSVNGPVAMGYVENEFSKKNTKIFLEVRGKKHPASICGLPFYKKSYVKGANK